MSSRKRMGIALALVAVLILGVFVVLWLVPEDRRPAPEFDGTSALQEIEKQVSFGPRAPGTDGHRRAREYFIETLEQLADRVSVQSFVYVDRRDSSKTYEGSNIIASFNVSPDVNRRIMLAAHWDTRPFADQDPVPERRTQPVPGANDGASGVAVLLETARVISEDPPDVGIDIVLFDLEDLGDDAEEDSVRNPFAIGSERFAEEYDDYRPSYGILLDMVCDLNLRIPKEANSLSHARRIVEKVWDAADRLDASAFVDERGRAVLDDHVAFLKRGIPVVDLIHTPFPSYWHTTNDLPDKCSAASLDQVGTVLLEVIYNE